MRISFKYLGNTLFVIAIIIQLLSVFLIVNDVWWKDDFWIPYFPDMATLLANGSNISFVVFPNQTFFIFNKITHNVSLSTVLMAAVALVFVGRELLLRKKLGCGRSVILIVGACIVCSLLILFF